MNDYVVKYYEYVFGENGIFCLIILEEFMEDIIVVLEIGFFFYWDDFFNFNEVVWDFLFIYEIEIFNVDFLKSLLVKLYWEEYVIFVFIKDFGG